MTAASPDLDALAARVEQFLHGRAERARVTAHDAGVCVDVEADDPSAVAGALGRAFGPAGPWLSIRIERWPRAIVRSDAFEIDDEGRVITAIRFTGQRERNHRLEVVESAADVCVMLVCERLAETDVPAWATAKRPEQAYETGGVDTVVHATLRAPLGTRQLIWQTR